jgi:tetratricopeptide (TPR) repeat protein
LERVLAINPQRAQAYQLRATVLAQGGQLEAAKSALDQAVQLAPGDLGGRQLLAEIATRLGDRGTAVAQYEAILAAEPSRESQARLHLLAADLLREERQLERALTHYRQALEADPQLADARFNLASMLGLLNRSEEALPHFRTLVEGAPDNEIFRLSEATALAFAGRYGELKRRLDEGIEAVPQSAALGQLLSRLLAAAPDPAVREPARSLALAKEAYAARPTPASAETLAIAFAATGDFAKAADIQNQLLDRLGPKADADSRQRWQARLKRYKAQQDCCVDGAANRAVAEMLFAGLYSG